MLPVIVFRAGRVPLSVQWCKRPPRIRTVMQMPRPEMRIFQARANVRTNPRRYPRTICPFETVLQNRSKKKSGGLLGEAVRRETQNSHPQSQGPRSQIFETQCIPSELAKKTGLAPAKHF